jgi:hypothetical protein
MSQPDVLVTFQIQGPSNSGVNITRAIKTDSEGLAVLSFRIPTEGLNGTTVIGTWKATAAIPTNNGTLTQNLSFTTQQDLEIASITLLDAQGNPQTSFQQGETVAVKLSIDNTGEAQTANITLNLQDSSGANLNQTRKENAQINANSTELQASIQIPINAAPGSATIVAGIFSGSYEGVDIPAAESKTASLTIVAAETEPTPTPTPTETPTASPTATPPPVENTVSLFMWLLALTGFSTFTLLSLFLRRKPSKLGALMSKMPVGAAGSTKDGESYESNLLSIKKRLDEIDESLKQVREKLDAEINAHNQASGANTEE